jgi:hypothetical protein
VIDRDGVVVSENEDESLEVGVDEFDREIVDSLLIDNDAETLVDRVVVRVLDADHEDVGVLLEEFVTVDDPVKLLDRSLELEGVNVKDLLALFVGESLADDDLVGD